MEFVTVACFAINAVLLGVMLPGMAPPILPPMQPQVLIQQPAMPWDSAPRQPLPPASTGP